MLLDGKTGIQMGRLMMILDEVGNKETYMSPVLHHTKDGAQYILFGSGGETVPGKQKRDLK